MPVENTGPARGCVVVSLGSSPSSSCMFFSSFPLACFPVAEVPWFLSEEGTRASESTVGNSYVLLAGPSLSPPFELTLTGVGKPRGSLERTPRISRGNQKKKTVPSCCLVAQTGEMREYISPA